MKKELIPIYIGLISSLLFIAGIIIAISADALIGAWLIAAAGFGYSGMFISAAIISGKSMTDLDFWL